MPRKASKLFEAFSQKGSFQLSAAMTGTKLRKMVVSDAETAVSASETAVSDAETAVSASKTAVLDAEMAVCRTFVPVKGTLSYY